MKTVFCDESGFTGENLWQADQPHFVYAAVAISEGDAAEIVESTRKKFFLNAPELHAAQLLRRDKGKMAVKSLVERIVPNSSVIVFHKRYSLACKMFEYLIEPAISDGNSLFYNIGFHKFISNSLYLALLAEPSTTKQTFIEFQETIRTGDVSKLEAMTNAIHEEGLAGLLGQISTFVTCNRHVLQEEIAFSENEANVPRWMLELTTTALMSLLGSISGAEMLPLSVTCDDSKPLLSQAQIFDAFVGRTDFQEIRFDGRQSQVTFNLGNKIKFESSKSSFGLQLADLVAGAAAFAMKKPEDEFSQFWRSTCAATLHQNGVIPNLEEVDLNTERAVVNVFVLHELVKRSVKGENLLRGMPQFIRFAQETAPDFLAERRLVDADGDMQP